MDNLESLARRAVACAGWRWMAGMHRTDNIVVRRRFLCHLCNVGPGWLPDLSDPGTLGHLLALVREKWGPLSCVGWDRDRKLWAVYCHMAMTVEEIWQPVATGASEAEALVAALEVARG